MASVTPSIEDLKGPNKDRIHTIDYVAQRVAWISMVLILLAAVLGLFGQGLFSQQHAAADDESLHVIYQAIDRYETPSVLRLQVPHVSHGADRLRMHFSKQFSDSITPESISPSPIRSTLQGEYVVYEFAVKDISDAEIVFRHKHDEPGWLTYDVAVEGHTPVSIRQFILP